MKVIVAQKGPREYFLAARAFQRHGVLAQLVVDWYTPWGPKTTAIFDKLNFPALSRASRARSDELPRRLIKSVRNSKLLSFLQSYGREPRGNLSEAFLKSDEGFARAVSRVKFPEHDSFFCYSYAALEALEVEKAAGKFCILDQIDPGEKEHQIICREEEKWPNYVTCPNSICRPYFARLHREWALADLIIVNSEWSRECNIEKGAPANKIEVLPLAYEHPVILPQPAVQTRRKAQILWIGRVTLQKGIQYLVEAARLLQHEPVEFLICGESAITSASMQEAPPNVRWLGKVGHDHKEFLFGSASAFVLPTLSDGFALTQLEALAHGLPVITTPNCGHVVENGKTGFIVPPRDSESLANAILYFIRDATLKSRMSVHCIDELNNYTIDAYGQKLMKIITNRIIPYRAGA